MLAVSLLKQPFICKPIKLIREEKMNKAQTLLYKKMKAVHNMNKLRDVRLKETQKEAGVKEETKNPLAGKKG